MRPPEPCRILIMDDNVGPACLAQSTLACAGYVAELAPGRAEAVTHHGGSIRFASTPGRGTTVTIELQRAETGG
jgi:hypothetical protein